MTTGTSSLPPLYRPNLAGWRYTQALRNAWENRAWIYDSADWASLEDPQAWNMMRRDADVMASIERRRRATAGLSWQSQPRSAQVPQDVLVASVCGHGLREHFSQFWRARYHQTEAPFRGSAHQIICWRRVRWAPPIEGCPTMTWWVPTHAKPVDRWRLRVNRNEDSGVPRSDRPYIGAHWELYSVARDQWEPLQQPLAWIHSTYSLDEDTLGYGRGLCAYLIWMFRAKEICLTQGIEGVERWAQGIVTAKVGREVVGSPGTNTSEVQDAWLDELAKMRSQNYLAYSEDDELEIHWPQGTGWQITEGLLRYLQEAMARLIEGATMASASNKGGSSGYAQSQTHRDEGDDYLAPDREMLSEDWTRSVMASFYRLNREQLAAICGLHGFPRIGACPHLSISDEEIEDPQMVVQVAAQALGAGIPLIKSEVYERLGYSQPGDGDDVFEQSAPDAPGAMGNQPPAPGSPTSGGNPLESFLG